MTYILTCKCCGHIEDMGSPQAAYEAGWDEPVHLPSWPVSCPLCPGTASMGLLDHSEAHAAWERDGRPAEYTTDGLRYPDGRPFEVVQEEIDRITAIVAKLRKSL